MSDSEKKISFIEKLLGKFFERFFAAILGFCLTFIAIYVIIVKPDFNILSLKFTYAYAICLIIGALSFIYPEAVAIPFLVIIFFTILIPMIKALL